jgi:phosphohistidine phosphatase
MRIYLVQHGKSLSKDMDPEKGLSEEGMEIVKRMAQVARDRGVKPSGIRHSGKKRALQTAEIFAKKLEPTGGVSEIAGLAPMDDVVAFAAGIKDLDGVMLVGHLPFMEKITGYLTAGHSEKKVFKFQNGGVVCLEKDPESSDWSIIWSLMPQLG